MSEYGRIWEDIRVVRDRLAEALGEPATMTNLESAIRKVAQRNTELAGLLARWAELEAQAAKLDADSGNLPKEPAS